MNATVNDVMTTPVIAVRADTTFKELAAKLRQYRVGAFPVLDGNQKLAGIVSEADLLAKEALSSEHAGLITAMLHRREREKAEGLTAGDLMTRSVVTVTPADPVEHAARLMYTLRVRRLPVVDAGGGLVGIVSRADVLAVYDRPDEEIRQELSRQMRHELLVDPRQFTVTVQAGVVTLEGQPETGALGHALVRQARRIQGVVAVRDRLAYPDMYPIVAGPVF
jgi:CBS domain-containing protein